MTLRVITGLRKGHKLKGPKGENSRPTEDKVKEAIFNIIGNIDENDTVLDLFACTGNVGIEFLSRGAKKAYFSELNNKNIENMEFNIAHTKFENQSVILRGDFRKNLMLIGENIDYVYIDPPYKSEYYKKAFDNMLKNKYFDNSLFIVEIDKDVDFSKIYDKLDLVYKKKYGRKYISFYREK